MENASRALTMAGGILIALLIIGALVLMFNQIGDYEKGKSSDEKLSQVVEFNKQFTQYTYDDIKGYELISLINKVIDYNGKNGVGNSVDYNKKITVEIDITGFAEKYGVDEKSLIFGKKTLYSNDDFSSKISVFSELENTYTLGVMSKLSANYDEIKAGDKSIKEIIGRDVQISMDQIEQHREYSELKNSTFRSDSEPIYDGEQVVGLSFKFVKNKR